MCTIGFHVMWPLMIGVSSPSRIATQPCASSCRQIERITHTSHETTHTWPLMLWLLRRSEIHQPPMCGSFRSVEDISLNQLLAGTAEVAAVACSTSLSKSLGSSIAICESILRLRLTPASLSPFMKSE